MSFINYNANLGKNKPSTIFGNVDCPFCSREQLRKDGRIIKEANDFFILNNKYPVLEDSFPTVLIEHNDCDQHIGTYTIEHLTGFLRFSLDFYKELKNDPQYESVMFFKNHGPFSGGSINHPHSQIIAFKNLRFDYNISPTDFEGVTILENDTIKWNISSKPRTEFFEFNLILKQEDKLDELANYLQKTVRFILERINPKHLSYNLAFYVEQDSIKLKVISRGPTSAILLGFGVHQTPDNLKEIAEEIRNY